MAKPGDRVRRPAIPGRLGCGKQPEIKDIRSTPERGRGLYPPAPCSAYGDAHKIITFLGKIKRLISDDGVKTLLSA